MSGPFEQQRFYRPYSSDSDTDSGSESDSSYSSDEQAPNFRKFATQLQINEAAGPSFSTLQTQLAYGADRVGRIRYSEYRKIPELPAELNYGTTKFETNRDSVTSLIMINSRDRDTNIYTQPTLFTVRLPRIYKNVINVQLQQVKLLTSFYYFRPDKYNVYINILEKDRDKITNAAISSLGVQTTITTGSYNINTLIAELSKQLNFTPLFYDFPDGFNEFYVKFRASGDLGLNFNEAGDWAYNGSTLQWTQNPTKNDIISVYWKSRYILSTTFTRNQALVAYYYPPLWEFLYDAQYGPTKINLTPGIGIYPSLQTQDEVANYLLNSFTGISDPVATAVITANISILDEYRTLNTFRYANINKYNVFYEGNSQKITISTRSLNTSLVNLLNLQRDKYLSLALSQIGITSNQYASLLANSQKTLAILQNMYQFYETQFLTYFAVPWAQYSIDYYTNIQNTIYLQNAQNVTGVPSNDFEAISSGIVTISNASVLIQKQSTIQFWPAMSSLTSSTVYMVNLSTSTENYNYVYRITQDIFDTTQPLIDSNNDFSLYSEFLRKEADAICPVRAGQYTLFQFKSPVRQTIQVETLPRPTKYRIPLYNQCNYSPNISTFFDMSYAFVTPSNENSNVSVSTCFDYIPPQNLIVIPGWSQDAVPQASPTYTYGIPFSTSILNWTTAASIDVTSFQRAWFGTFFTPNVSNASPLSNYKYEVSINILFYSNLTSTDFLPPPQMFRAFIYHDRAAFQADAYLIRNENPRFWNYSTVIDITSYSSIISFFTYPNQQYYVTLRADTTGFASVYPRIVPYFAPGFQQIAMTRALDGINPGQDPLLSNFDPAIINSNWNYAQVYDKDFIRLPITSTLWAPDPSSNATTSNLPTSNVPIGHDTNDVSSDYTDYIPFVRGSFCNSFYPADTIGIDPINQYQFQLNSPYNSTTQTYFYTNSLNQVFTPNFINIYTNTAVARREIKLVHYYSLNYIPNSEITPSIAPYISQDSVAQLPYSISTTSTAIHGYDYATSQSTLQLSLGVLGFSILPQEGVWDLTRIVFRSAIQESNQDPNAEIKYMAVYTMGDILSTNTSNLTMSTAIFVLSNSARVTYTASTLSTSVTGDDFDVKGGTYYEFLKDSTFPQNSNAYLLGYQQAYGTMRRQPESIYTAIAFNQYGVAVTIKGLSGSAIPYPLYNNAVASTTYIDGTYAPDSNRGVVIPEGSNQTLWPWAAGSYSDFKPPQGNDGSQSQYALSIPIATTALNYKVFVDPNQDSNYLKPWSTIHSPTNIVTNIANYALLQDTSFYIYSYPINSPSRTFSNLHASLSVDQVYPSAENTSFAGVNGNSSAYYFLGLQQISPTELCVRLKEYNPSIDQLMTVSTTNTLRIPISSFVQSFTVNDLNQVVITSRNIPTDTTYIYFTQSNYYDAEFSSFTISNSLNAIHDSDPLASTIWFLQVDGAGRGSTIGVGYIDSLATTAPTYYTIDTTTGPLFYNGIGVNTKSEFVTLSTDEVVLYTIDESDPSYRRKIWYLSNYNDILNEVSSIPFATDMTTINHTTAVVTGYGGSFWVLGDGSTPIWANRRTEVDTDGVIDTAWQIFYPFQKITLVQLSNTFNPITDLTNLAYPEYPHVNMFYYDTETALNADILTQWGNEKNYVTNDTNMSGYYFNSYIFNIQVLSNTGTSNFHYLAVRGYCPTESFQTLIRFYAPNLYDFGLLTFQNLIEEIDLNSSNNALFNAVYSATLSNFNTQFIQSNIFGGGIIAGYDGSTITTTGFSSFFEAYSTVYTSYITQANIVSSVNGIVNGNLNQFISTQLVNILPPSAILRENYTDPLTFSILWKSQLTPAYAALRDDWGLGFNLGYAKEDTPYNTVAKATSFYKILDDYIYLRLNPEYKMNMMDTSSKEDLSITRDTTGQVQQYYGKLLLNNFNSYSQTMVNLPVQLNPPLGRVAQMTFQWVDLVGAQIDNNDCEWSAALQIVESLVLPSPIATFPALPPPK